MRARWGLRRGRVSVRLIGPAAVALVVLPPSDRADAQPRADLPVRQGDTDPTDGRIDGDLDVVVGLGGTLYGNGARGVAEARLRYVETAGVFVTYEDGFGDDATPSHRAVTAGLEVRPLFLARWLTGRELGLSWLDLAIDSFGLELGACFQQPAERSFDSLPALQAGLGLELPLLSRATGPWLGLHAGGRWNDGLVGGAVGGGPAFFLSITLAYHHVFATHLVDLQDRAP